MISAADGSGAGGAWPATAAVPHTSPRRTMSKGRRINIPYAKHRPRSSNFDGLSGNPLLQTKTPAASAKGGRLVDSEFLRPRSQRANRLRQMLLDRLRPLRRNTAQVRR